MLTSRSDADARHEGHSKMVSMTACFAFSSGPMPTPASKGTAPLTLDRTP